MKRPPPIQQSNTVNFLKIKIKKSFLSLRMRRLRNLGWRKKYIQGKPFFSRTYTVFHTIENSLTLEGLSKSQISAKRKYTKKSACLSVYHCLPTYQAIHGFENIFFIKGCSYLLHLKSNVYLLRILSFHLLSVNGIQKHLF